MINTWMSRNSVKVEADGFGVNIMPEDVKILADAIEDLYEKEEKRLEMGRKPDRSQKNSLTVRRHIRELQS